jgi:hypothetical protein
VICRGVVVVATVVDADPAAAAQIGRVSVCAFEHLGGDPARGDLRLTVELALKLSDLPRLSG